jgi:hypothetical protein
MQPPSTLSFPQKVMRSSINLKSTIKSYPSKEPRRKFRVAQITKNFPMQDGIIDVLNIT